MGKNSIFGDLDENRVWLTSPTGHNLGLVCTSSTTIYSDTSAKEINVPERYVLLKISTVTTGYTLQKLYGHPNVAGTWEKSTEQQPAVVVPTYRAKVILFDSSKGDAGSSQHEIDVTRDAWYYLGVDHNNATWCRNIAFEPADGVKNRYLTDQIHFPSAANSNVHGFFLMETESQRGHAPRLLRAERVSNANRYGAPIPFRKDESLAADIMFHIGGFYEASLSFSHAKWLGGSEGCFAFVPSENVHGTPESAAEVTLETAFFSNKTWVNLTSMIERYRDSDPQKRFFVEIERRIGYPRDSIKKIIKLSAALDGTFREINRITSNIFIL
jgi:hypothetical protein